MAADWIPQQVLSLALWPQPQGPRGKATHTHTWVGAMKAQGDVMGTRKIAPLAARKGAGTTDTHVPWGKSGPWHGALDQIVCGYGGERSAQPHHSCSW